MLLFRLNYRLLLVMLLALATGCSKNTDTPEAVVRAYYKAVAKSNLRHVANENNETEIQGDASEIFALYNLDSFSPEDLVKVKKSILYSAFNKKREFDREGGLEKIETLGIDRIGQDEEGFYSLVKYRTIFKNGKTEENFDTTYQRGKQYKKVFPQEILDLLKH